MSPLTILLIWCFVGAFSFVLAEDIVNSCKTNGEYIGFLLLSMIVSPLIFISLIIVLFDKLKFLNEKIK